MQYKIKPWALSAGGYNYDIMNADGKIVCQLKAEINFLNRGNVLDLSNHPLAHISQRILSLTSEFDITMAARSQQSSKKSQPVSSIQHLALKVLPALINWKATGRRGTTRF